MQRYSLCGQIQPPAVHLSNLTIYAPRTCLQGIAAADSAAVCALSYDIDLKLDTEKERMEQTVFMDIINKSGNEDFSSLYIRYYPNGYIGALMKENPEIKEENEGRSSAVTSVTWKGSDEQLKITYDQDDTLIKVDLESDPLKAGETRTL